MQNQDTEAVTRIEGIAGDPQPSLTGASDDPYESGDFDSVTQSLASEAARQMVIGSDLSFFDIADQVGGGDWLADTPNRVQTGQSDALREDLIYQSPDWERATGRSDNPTSDLIG